MSVSATNIANLLDGVNGLELLGAQAVTSYQIGSTTYLYVNSYNDDTVSVFEVDALGVPTLVQTVTDDGNGGAILDGSRDGSIVEVGDKVFYLAVADIRDGLSVFEVGGDGQLTFVSETVEDGTLFLDNPRSAPFTLTIGSSTYVYVTGDGDDGISVFSLGTDGTLSSEQNIANSGDLNLDGARNFESVEIAGKTFLVVSGVNSNGLSVFEVGSDGMLTNVFNIDDDANSLLTNTDDLKFVQVGGNTFLYAADFDGDGVSIFQMNGDGSLEHISNVVDSGNLQIDGALGIETAEIGGVNYLVVSSFWDNGASFFRVGEDGSLTETFSVTHGMDGAALSSAHGMEITEIEGVPYLYITSQGSDSVTAYRLNFPISVDYNGSTYEMAETLAGAVGMAEAGSTISVVDAALYADVSEVIHVSRDNITVDLGASSASHIIHLDDFAFNFEVIGGGSNVTVYGSSANDETITVGLTGAGFDVVYGRGGDDTLIASEGAVDFFGGAGEDELYGNTNVDYLFGGSGSDSIFGGGGSDSLVGAWGSDLLEGASGSDTLLGEKGGDTLFGGQNNDYLYGGDGKDFLDGNKDDDEVYGGKGDDSVSGDKGADILHGGQNNDSLFGGDGNDTMFGGKDDDDLFGGKGFDEINGGAGKDTLSGDNGNDTLFGGYGDDTLFGGSGSDVLTGGRGSNSMTGGDGADTFVFTLDDQLDVITDFEHGVDTLSLNYTAFGYGSAQEFIDGEAVNVNGNYEFATGQGTLILEGIDINLLAADMEVFPA